MATNDSVTTTINIQKVRDYMKELYAQKDLFNDNLKELQTSVSDTVGNPTKFSGGSADDFLGKWNNFKDMFDQFTLAIQNGAETAERVAQEFAIAEGVN